MREAAPSDIPHPVYDIGIFLAGALTAAVATAALLVPRLRRAEALDAARGAELAQLRAERDGMPDRIAAENAELRRRMDELADAIMLRAGGPPPPPPLSPDR